jgi:hypothetical protein
MYIVIARCYMDDVPLKLFTDETPDRASEFLQTLDIEAELKNSEWVSSTVNFVSVYELIPNGDGIYSFGPEIDTRNYEGEDPGDQE